MYFNNVRNELKIIFFNLKEFETTCKFEEEEESEEDRWCWRLKYRTQVMDLKLMELEDVVTFCVASFFWFQKLTNGAGKSVGV
jgi:hypothetical protein